MCCNKKGFISTLNGGSLKLVDKFMYLKDRVASTENDTIRRQVNEWTANVRLSIIWKSDPSDKTKKIFFQAVVVSILLYRRTAWTLTKQTEKKLRESCTRILRAILNESLMQDPSKQQRFSHQPPISKTTLRRRTSDVSHCWRSKDEHISDVLQWTPSHRRASFGRPIRTYLKQLFTDTGCSLKDLPKAIVDRDERQTRVWEICARSVT